MNHGFRFKERITLLFFFLASLSPNAFGWCNNCSSTGCCPCPGQAQCMGSHATCEEACGLTQGVGGSSSGGSSPANQIMQNMMQNFVQGLMNPTPDRPKTPQEIEQERQQAILRQQAEEARQKKIRDYVEAQKKEKQDKEDALDREAQDSIVLFNSGTSGAPRMPSDEELIGGGKTMKETRSLGASRGSHDASECISRSAGSACSTGTAEETEACVAGYNDGYDLAAKNTEILMQAAFSTGETAGQKGELANGPADERAKGGCRVQWIEKYNKGYFKGRHLKSKEQP